MQLLQIKDIRLDGGTQPRATTHREAIDDYADAITDGAKFPPVTVFFDGSHYWLADGFHRVRAHIKLDIKEIEAEIQQGTQQDAQWYSLSVNQTHGLRRTRADVERAIKFALLHPEVIPTGENSNSGIAKHIGTSHPTVAKYRNELITSGILKDFQDTPRVVTRNGTTYTQNTSNIGKKPAPVVQEREPIDREPQVLNPTPNHPEHLWPALAGPNDPNLPLVVQDEEIDPETAALIESISAGVVADPVLDVDPEVAIALTRVEDFKDALTKVLKFADIPSSAALDPELLVLLKSTYGMVGRFISPPMAEPHDQFTIDAP